MQSINQRIRMMNLGVFEFDGMEFSLLGYTCLSRCRNLAGLWKQCLMFEDDRDGNSFCVPSYQASNQN
jgi:hypothetical protein